MSGDQQNGSAPARTREHNYTASVLVNNSSGQCSSSDICRGISEDALAKPRNVRLLTQYVCDRSSPSLQ